MLTLIYRETKATKAMPSVRYIYGFTRIPAVLRPEADYAILTNLSVSGAVRKAAERSVKAYEKAVKPQTVKGAALVALLQGAHAVQLSKGERRFLFAEMRLAEEATGLSTVELLKAA